jgi:hypothetical protein
VSSVEALPRRRSPRLFGTGIAILILIMLGFTVKRLVIDLPNLAAGTLPDNAYDTRFVRHPWLLIYTSRRACSLHSRCHPPAGLLVPQPALQCIGGWGESC